MNISLNWLYDYVDHGLSADALGEALTLAGLELEEIERTGPSWLVDGGVVVGRVLDVRPHPNADRLRLCDVDLGPEHGDGEPVQIVCGAPNVEAGQTVPVATVGTVLDLPARDGSGLQPVTIQKGKIRGEVSLGMICAEDELGVGESHDGILVLDPDAPVGQSFAAYLAERGDLPGDAVLDLAITPNRPDATSHLGVARDVAALTGQPLRRPETEIPPVGGAVDDAARVTIEAPDACPRFVAVVVEGVTVGPSPEWLQERLRAIGLRPISNIVDVTNFVMHETGQPLHAYDLDRLAEHRLVVKRAVGGETFTTLDGTERTLPEGTTMVADGGGYVGIAGIMGGLDSEVTDATTRVLIEGATWTPADIRRAAKALGMQTDASYRFERGTDPTLPPYAVARAAEMTATLAGGTILDGRIDENPVPYEARTVSLRPSRVARVLGVAVPRDEIVRLLAAIGFEVQDDATTTLDAFAEAVMHQGAVAAAEDATDTSLTVTVPPFRPDVEREVDVIEEVARLWGYDRLPTPASTPVPLVPAGDSPSARHLASVRRQLASLGLREIATNSLVPKATAERFADADWTALDGPPVETLNPISQEMAAMRPSLLPGLLGALAYNQARGADVLRVFEAGRVYRRASAEASGAVEGYHEHTALGIGLSGTVPATWNGEARETDLYDLKGIVQAVLSSLGIDGVVETPHPAPSALTAYALDLSVRGDRIGRLGRIADALAADLDLQAPAFVAELDWDRVAALAGTTEVRYTPISRFPTAERDLALVVSETQPAGPILDAIRQAGGPLLQSVRPFDVYRGTGVAEGHKSLAVALVFGADRTLRDEEVDGRVRKIVRTLEGQFGATLRA